MLVCRNPISEVDGVSYALCMDDSMSHDYQYADEAPKPIIKIRRPSGHSYGSGSYFCSKKFPYLEPVKFQGPYKKTYACNTDGESTSTSRDSGGYNYWLFSMDYTEKTFEHEYNSQIECKRLSHQTCYKVSGKVRHGHLNFNWIQFEEIMVVQTKSGKFFVSQSYFCTQRDSGNYTFGITGGDVSGIPGAAMRTCSAAKCDMSVTPGKNSYGIFTAEDGTLVECWAKTTTLSYEKCAEPAKAPWLFDSDYDQEGTFLSIVDLGIIPSEIKQMVAAAYSDALDQLPEVSANSIVNTLELSSSLISCKNLVDGGAKALARSAREIADPRNSWLSWRYVYNTTKMDINDYRDITNRLIQLAGQPTFKISAISYDDPNIRVNSCKVTRTLSTTDFDVELMSKRKLLETYGFKLSAYNVWDMIPFSFMIDWFIPVGELLDSLEKWKRSQELGGLEDWFSCRFQFAHGYTYFRWHGVIPSLPPLVSKREVGTKTLVYRLADTIAIFS